MENDEGYSGWAFVNGRTNRCGFSRERVRFVSLNLLLMADDLIALPTIPIRQYPSPHPAFPVLNSMVNSYGINYSNCYNRSCKNSARSSNVI